MKASYINLKMHGTGYVNIVRRFWNRAFLFKSK